MTCTNPEMDYNLPPRELIKILVDFDEAEVGQSING